MAGSTGFPDSSLPHPMLTSDKLVLNNPILYGGAYNFPSAIFKSIYNGNVYEIFNPTTSYGEGYPYVYFQTWALGNVYNTYTNVFINQSNDGSIFLAGMIFKRVLTDYEIKRIYEYFNYKYGFDSELLPYNSYTFSAPASFIVFDKSYHNDLELTGNVSKVAGRDGITSNAINIGVDGHIKSYYSISPLQSGQFSLNISFKYLYDSSKSGKTLISYGCIENGKYTGWSIRYGDSGTIYFISYSSSGYTMDEIRIPYTFSHNNWYSLIFSYKEDFNIISPVEWATVYNYSLILYINGVCILNHVPTANIIHFGTSSRLTLGGYWNSDTNEVNDSLSVSIDRLYTYNSLVTSSVIDSLSYDYQTNHTLPAKTGGLISQWNPERVVDENVYDYGLYNGILHNVSVSSIDGKTAFYFSGVDSYINIPGDVHRRSSETFTMNFSLYITEDLKNKAIFTLALPNVDHGFSFCCGDGVWGIGRKCNSIAFPSTGGFKTSPLDLNAWINVTFKLIHSSNTLNYTVTGYINGIKIGTYTLNDSSSSDGLYVYNSDVPTSCIVGALGYTDSSNYHEPITLPLSYFKGYISSIEIINLNLTDAQVLSRFGLASNAPFDNITFDF